MFMAQSQTGFKDTALFKMGHSWELKVAGFLKKRGNYVIPSYDYSGEENDKAPKLQGALSEYVIPDLDVSKDGERRWVEVKSKTGAVLHRNSGDYVHGIPKRHYQSYLKVSKITGCEIWIVICEENTGDVLVANLNSLPIHHEYDGPKMSKGGMIFFNRNSFTLLTKTPTNVATSAGAR
jgi:hypothetical protein